MKAKGSIRKVTVRNSAFMIQRLEFKQNIKKEKPLDFGFFLLLLVFMSKYTTIINFVAIRQAAAEDLGTHRNIFTQILIV